MTDTPTTLSIFRLRTAVDADLVDPLIQELERALGARVCAESFDRQGPASGFVDAAVQIVVDYHGWAALAYAFKRLADPSLDEAGNRIRDRLFRVNQQPERGTLPQGGYLPLVIGFGSGSYANDRDAPVRYVFLRATDRDDFQSMLDAMVDHVAKLPPELFNGQGGPLEYSFFWDEEHKLWRGCVWVGPPEGTWGECWLPPVFSPGEQF